MGAGFHYSVVRGVEMERNRGFSGGRDGFDGFDGCVCDAADEVGDLLCRIDLAEVAEVVDADVLFLGVDGFDVHYGLSTPNLLEAKVNRVMVEVAKRTVVVADSSKFGRRSLSRIVPPSALHQIITDRGIPKSDLRTLKKAGIEVTLV